MRGLTWQVLQGDVREQLRQLPEESMQTVVTSPPYWGLRDYGHAGQLGLESTPEEYVAAMVEVFREVRRVLREDGTLWLNLGDSYAGGGGFAPNAPCNQARARGEQWGALRPAKMARHEAKEKPAHAKKAPEGLKPKDLVGIPWRVAFALQADGWWLRSEIIWHKPNPMPESATDRPTRAHEHVFLLTRSDSYFYDADAVKEPCVSLDPEHPSFRPNSVDISKTGRKTFEAKVKSARTYNPEGRNRRTVWTVPTSPFPGAHFATFPEALVLPCVLAGSRPGDTVLDPFNGSGTTGVVALKQGRSYVGVELNPEYVAMSERRLAQVAPLLAQRAEVTA